MKTKHWIFFVGATAAACFLRRQQLRTGFGTDGLPVRGNAAAQFVLPLALVVIAVAAVLLCRSAPAADEITGDFGSVFDFGGTTPLFYAVAGIFLLFGSTAVSLLFQKSTASGLLFSLLPALSGAAVLYALFSLRRSRPFSGSVLLVPVAHLLLALVFTYRSCAKDPVLAHYYPTILALAALGWASVQLTAFVFRNGSARAYLPSAMLAIVLSGCSLVGTADLSALFLFMGFALIHAAFLAAFVSEQ